MGLKSAAPKFCDGWTDKINHLVQFPVGDEMNVSNLALAHVAINLVVLKERYDRVMGLNLLHMGMVAPGIDHPVQFQEEGINNNNEVDPEIDHSMQFQEEDINNGEIIEGDDIEIMEELIFISTSDEEEDVEVEI